MRVYDITLAVAGVAATAATLALSALPESTSLFSFKKKLDAPEALSVDFEFSKWAAEFNKQYDSIEEYEHRLEQFKKNFYELRMLNSMNSQATFGLNQFSDWSEEEYNAILGDKPDYSDIQTVYFDESSIANGGIDWRANGKVNPIKNQGSCGSCWAFSATCSMESRHAIKNNKLIRLSEQEVVDCSTSNSGCNGGSFKSAWNDIKNKGGMMTESSYPYTAKQGTCKFSSSGVVAKVSGTQAITAGSASQVKAALSNGPISISVAAGNTAFRNYKSGIWDGAGCPTNTHDHAINVVGWGTSGTQEYFIIRNSWGTSWGESGYARFLSTSGNGVCGMFQNPGQVTMA